MQFTKNFTLKELTVTTKPVPNVPSPAEVERLRLLAVHILQPLRDAVGRPVIVTSAFRSPRVNSLVGGSRTSQHLRGEAADIKIEGMSPLAVAKLIAELGLPFDQLIREPTWVHVSYGPRHRREKLTIRAIGTRAIVGLH